jgi:hypothetical protein
VNILIRRDIGYIMRCEEVSKGSLADRVLPPD